MPTGDEDLRRIALMNGNVSFEEFSPVLEKHMRKVEEHYAELFEEEAELSGALGNLVFTGDDDDPETLATLEELSFHRPSAIIRLVRGWHFGRYRAMQTAEARARLTELTPELLQAFAQTSSADDAAFAFDRFLQGLPAGVQLFALLKSNPELLRLLAEVLGIAPRLADIITRKPHVFDSLLEPQFFQTMPTREQLAARLKASLGRATSYEEGLDRARIFALEQKFLIGIRYLGTTIDAAHAARAFSDLADVMITAMLNYVQCAFEEKHGRVAGGQMAVVGMGRLGSQELSVGSDLDLILLYNHDLEADYSDGDKPLAASQYFARLTQRLIAAMSALTAEGAIYELDFRLRPSGRAGPLATHIDAFVRYQEKEAWTWEHMALTRSRVVAGDEKLVEKAGLAISRIVSAPYDHKKMTKDVLDMRQRLEQEKPARSIWDIKTAVGGLLDIDFILQWASLAGFIKSDGIQPVSSADKIAALSIPGLEDQSLQNDKMTLGNALNIYSAIDQLLRLCLNGAFDPDEAPAGLVDRLVVMTGFPDLSNLEAHLKDSNREVRAVYDRLLRDGVDSNNGKPC
jgi:glutamate-ammonia-ligase adenylyltransferase